MSAYFGDVVNPPRVVIFVRGGDVDAVYSDANLEVEVYFADQETDPDDVQEWAETEVTTGLKQVY